MASEFWPRDNQDAAPASSPEVEFALVLSRMIDSVKNDPRHLRETVYELARRKLHEQFAYENAKDARSISDALEKAIQGVEAFARKADQSGIQRIQKPDQPALERPRPVTERATTLPVSRQVLDVVASTPNASIRPSPPPKLSVTKRSSSFAPLWRLVILLAVVAVIAFAARQRGLTFEMVRSKADFVLARLASRPTVPASPPPVVAMATRPTEPVVAPAPKPLVPTSYGIYAVDDDKLYELELLPGRAPDIRVAISAAITTPSRTNLPDGRLRFIVYRRDSATVAADHAEVRVIAKIARATSFDAAGKAVVSDAGDSWVIRNISIPYRTAPSKDEPDMYEIQSENPEAALPPGRYALVLKGQAYDFTVAGAVTDPKQCLERLVATNGQFYSQCQKP